MKKFSILLIIMPLFILSSCTVIYPSLPNAYIEDIPSDGVEVYCYKDKNNWFCGATSSNIKTEEEIRSLQFVNLLEMKKILKSKGLYKHWYVYEELYKIRVILKRTIFNKRMIKHPFRTLFFFGVNMIYRQDIKRRVAPNIF